MTPRPRSEAESAMLERLSQDGPASRADLARRLGVTRATAGTLAARLIEEGIVEAVPAARAEGRAVGRPGERLAIAPDHAHVLGIDAGIGFVLGLRMDLAGRVRRTERAEREEAGAAPEAVVAQVAALARRLAEGGPPVAGVSVSIPGIVTRAGHVMRAPFLGWRDVPLQDMLEAALGRLGPLSLENDANALAMGEVIRGRVPPGETAIFLSMDVGVGGGIIRDGRLIDGQSGLAGEFGHIFVHPSTGLEAVRLEEVIGRRAVLERHRQLGGTARGLEGFLAAHEAGDPAARRVAGEWVEVTAQALSTLTSVLDPGRIVFGGSMSALARRVRPELELAYDRLLMHGTARPRLVLAESAEHSVARGCADLQRAALFRPHQGREARRGDTRGEGR